MVGKLVLGTCITLFIISVVVSHPVGPWFTDYKDTDTRGSLRDGLLPKPQYKATLNRGLVNNYCAGHGTSEYDDIFRAAIKRLPPGYNNDWCLLKAQCYIESHLRANVESDQGAKGVCQLLDTTFNEQQARKRFYGDVWDPKPNIMQAAGYMSWIIDQWYAERTDESRLRLSWASYNWGLGNVLRAQVKSRGARDWEDMEVHAPEETRNYVLKIEKQLREWKDG